MITLTSRQEPVKQASAPPLLSAQRIYPPTETGSALQLRTHAGDLLDTDRAGTGAVYLSTVG